VVFGKGRKGRGRRKWKWKGKELEEVGEFKYLGYMFDRKGGQERQMREVGRRARVVMREVWGIGKRWFDGEWKRKIRLFDALVGSVMLYGAEVWGWKEREEVEKIQDRFLRWSLGLDWRTPGYMVREEVKREKIRPEAGKRAVKYKGKLERGEGGEIGTWIWQEMRERMEKGYSKWEKEREGYYWERGVDVREVVKRREMEGGGY
jgi:hypothetical protein